MSYGVIRVGIKIYNVSRVWRRNGVIDLNHATEMRRDCIETTVELL